LVALEQVRLTLRVDDLEAYVSHLDSRERIVQSNYRVCLTERL